MIILEEFTDSWNYTFIIVVTIAILIGTIITIINIKRNVYLYRRKKRSIFSNNKDTK